MSTNVSPKNIIGGLTGIFLLSLLALVVIDLSNTSRIPPADFGAIPDFKLVERSGKIFGRPDMLGKVSIVNFFFTTCRGPCPAMNAQVAELYRKYVTSPEVQFISISVDPYDSPEMLQEYARRYGVNDQRWLFLHGTGEEVADLSERGFKLGVSVGSAGSHSIKLVLVDGRCMIRGYYSSLDQAELQLLTVHVRELLGGL